LNHDTVPINRAPVLALWASVVAECLGYDRGEARSLGKALAAINARPKTRPSSVVLRVEKPAEARKMLQGEEFLVVLLGRSIPAKNTPEGVRAVDEGRLVNPEFVDRYLQGKFNHRLADVEAAMMFLARSFKPDKLSAGAFTLYERFRPAIPEGVKGRGAPGGLDLSLIRSLAPKS
jgi:hypothetical protein